jgi:hypothetical protein
MAENAADMIAKRRCHNQNVTHCPQSHEYTPENTYVYPDGRRGCKACRSAADPTYKSNRRNREALSRA